MQESKQHTNITKISQQTYKFFDEFAETIKNIDVLIINKPTKVITDCAGDKIKQVLDFWGQNNLIKTGTEMSAINIAKIQILTVLKKRGFSLSALRQIKNTLENTMYPECSVLDFAVLLCRKMFVEYAEPHLTPFLIIDGENRITLGLEQDLLAIIGKPETKTFSHTVLNLMTIFDECDVVLKINSSAIGEFIDLSPKIAAKLYDPIVKKITIDKNANRLHTIANSSADPQFGERIIKYQNGHIVLDEVKATEVLNA